MSEDSPSEDAALVAVWEQLKKNWADESAHSGFLDMAQTSSQLSFAAKSYRAAQGDDEFKSRATDQLKKITALAFAQLEASHTPPPQTKRIITWVAFAVSIVIITGCFLALRS